MTDVSTFPPRRDAVVAKGATKAAAPALRTRGAGYLYLVIIVLGLFSEVVVRSRLFVEGDPVATATNVANSEALFRLAFLADSLMVLCDVALAVLLYDLFEPVSRSRSLMAAAFRLTQAAVLGMNLLHHHGAWLALRGGAWASTTDLKQVSTVVYHALDLHRHGYDLGLLFFGVNCLVLGRLALRANYVPRVLGMLLIGASGAYLVGSYTRFLFPGAVPLVAPIYLVAVVAEVAFCLWLLTAKAHTHEPLLENNND